MAARLDELNSISLSFGSKLSIVCLFSLKLRMISNLNNILELTLQVPSNIMYQTVKILFKIYEED